MSQNRSAVWGFWISGFLGLLALVYFGFPQLYLWTENRNFAKLRAQHEEYLRGLDCTQLPIHCLLRDQKWDQLPSATREGFVANRTDSLGHTAISFLIHHNGPDQWPRAETLLAAGDSPKICSQDGRCPLWTVLNQKHFDFAKLLVAHGADPNQKVGYQNDPKKMTLLNHYITQREFEVVRFLHQQGANPTEKDDWGYDACGRAKLYGLENQLPFCSRVN